MQLIPHTDIDAVLTALTLVNEFIEMEDVTRENTTTADRVSDADF